jgi:predicted Zn-dependent protease
MEMTKTHKIIIGIIVLILLLVAFMLWNRKGDTAKIDTVNKVIPGDIPGTLKGIDPNGGTYTITPVEIDGKKSVPTPSLDRPLTVHSMAVVSAEIQAYATEKIKAMQTLLKKDSKNLSAWIDLGIYQKIGGDFDGAILSWKYVGAIADKDSVAYGNIGNLYAYYLKDNAQAEMYYKKAIANGPMNVNLYIQFAEVYRDVFGDIQKARDIIAQGLTKIPNDESLLQMQASLK